MDNYVLAVAKKKVAIRMMKELSDIVSLVNIDTVIVCVCVCVCTRARAHEHACVLCVCVFASV